VSHRQCLLNPITEIEVAADLLQSALAFHLNKQYQLAEKCIRDADMPIISSWTEAIWGKIDPDIHRTWEIHDAPPLLPKENRIKARMPSNREKLQIIERDGYNCRFCKIPVIPKAVRVAMGIEYPDAARWGTKNAEQHAALQAMWLQFDHVLPHSRGGNNQVDNIIITCAPCNFGRMDWTLDELGLKDPRKNPCFQKTGWDGLVGFRA